MKDSSHNARSITWYSSYALLLILTSIVLTIPMKEKFLPQPEMNKPTQISETKFLSVMPGYAVKDMSAALEFYNSKLGFKTTFSNGPKAAPTYAIVELGGFEFSLMLEKKGNRAGAGSCYLKVKNIDVLYEELQKKGVVMVNELKTEEYGMREFMIKDPDGNSINFGEYVGD